MLDSLVVRGFLGKVSVLTSELSIGEVRTDNTQWSSVGGIWISTGCFKSWLLASLSGDIRPNLTTFTGRSVWRVHTGRGLSICG